MSDIIDRLNSFLDVNVTSGHLEKHEVYLIEETIAYINKLESEVKNLVSTEY